MQDLIGVSITESFVYQTGNLGDLNAPTNKQTWTVPRTIDSKGIFTDTLSTNNPFTFLNVSGTAGQVFTATGRFGSQPLDILLDGKSYSGVNGLVFSSSGVSVNGITSYNCE